MEQRDQFVCSCMLDFSPRGGEQEETKFSILKTPMCLFAFHAGKRKSPQSVTNENPVIMQQLRNLKFQLNLFLLFLNTHDLLFLSLSIRDMHLDIINACRVILCKADSEKSITSSTYFTTIRLE